MRPPTPPRFVGTTGARGPRLLGGSCGAHTLPRAARTNRVQRGQPATGLVRLAVDTTRSGWRAHHGRQSGGRSPFNAAQVSSSARAQATAHEILRITPRHRRSRTRVCVSLVSAISRRARRPNGSRGMTQTRCFPWCSAAPSPVSRVGRPGGITWRGWVQLLRVSQRAVGGSQPAR
jgi:hypothetical protein